jgi:hypothetical protein
MLDERPNCPIHNKPMIPWQFPKKNSTEVIYGFKCLESGCKVIYSHDFGGFCTLTLDETPVPFHKSA